MSLNRRQIIASLGATGLGATGLGATSLGAGLPGAAHGQEPPPRLRDRIKQRRSTPKGALGKGYEAAAAYSRARNGVSLLVLEGGKVLFEDYPAPDGGPDKGWELASGTKSFTGIMAAAASADGLLRLDEPAHQTLHEWAADPGLAKISIRHLLTLCSGIAIEGPTARPPGYAAAVRSASVQHPAGQVFAYGPEPFQIFGEILSRKLKAAGLPASPAAWLQTRLFDRLGIAPVDWRAGPDGNPMLPQGAHFRARDWGTFGQWVFDGCDGVDPAAARAMFESSPANPGYGLSWWLLRPGLKGPSPRAGVDETTIGAFAMGEDIVMAAGGGFQRLYLCRKRKLVIVRQANKILEQMRPGGIAFKDGEFLETLLG